MSTQTALLPDIVPDTLQAVTRDEEYDRYIHSAQWKQLRAKALQRANGRCERCEVSAWSVTLEVHHKTYVRFQHESLDDLAVLCPACHKQADKERPFTQGLYSDAVNPMVTKIKNWAKWKFGDDWKNAMSWNDVVDKYFEWRELGLI